MADTGSSDGRSSAWKLFHSVVVLGAALGSAGSGCGQAASYEPGSSGGQPGSNSGAGGQGAATGGQPATGGVTVTIEPGFPPRTCNYARSERGTVEAPLGPGDCPAPEQLSCHLGASGTVECMCDPKAPLTPDACITTSQFQCAVFEPTRACCYCDADVPPDAGACRDSWRCYSYDPPVGCQCVVVIL